MTSSSVTPVLVLGGTGKTGRRVAAALTRAGFTPKIASRSGEVRFDWHSDATWGPALEGVRAVYVVDSQGPEAPAEVAAFAKAAKASGVERLVLLSARVWGELGGETLATERAVQESGLDWTVLRPAWFNQNFAEEPWYTVPFSEGELRIPAGEGREPFVDLEDLADVAVAALTEDGHAGETYVLSGPEALTLHEVVTAVSTSTGRPLTYTPVTREQYIEEMEARGYPRAYGEVFSDLFHHISVSGSAELSDGVRRAIGREPRPFSDYVSRTDFDAVLDGKSA
ncbi:NmrA family protein [Streptomyces inusitatus]|uniref:NmrA family protein n=1 Tax=Streptomyces inusitatus TaxID=68221 RepID=A0A918PXT1_9ACTN|nr:NAD(P)H-binding protein [Streptomyces inusitatus]GGZ25499.1 NmrA family protein [Streptomyces inusitatus]